jgi:hypothetical protein
VPTGIFNGSRKGMCVSFEVFVFVVELAVLLLLSENDVSQFV